MKKTLLLSVLFLAVGFFAGRGGRKATKSSEQITKMGNQSSLTRVDNTQDFYVKLLTQNTKKEESEPEFTAHSSHWNEILTPEAKRHIKKNPREAIRKCLEKGGKGFDSLSTYIVQIDASHALDIFLTELPDGCTLQTAAIAKSVSYLHYDNPAILAKIPTHIQQRLARYYSLDDNLMNHNALEKFEQIAVNTFSDSYAKKIANERIVDQKLLEQYEKLQDEKIKAASKDSPSIQARRDLLNASHRLDQISGLNSNPIEVNHQLNEYAKCMYEHQKINLEPPTMRTLGSSAPIANDEISRWLAQQKNALLRTWMADYADAWAHSEPQKAIDWLNALADCKEKTVSLQRCVVRWAQAEPMKAAAHVEKLPASSLRDSMIADVAAAYAYYNQAAAEKWLEQLPDSEGTAVAKKRIKGENP